MMHRSPILSYGALSLLSYSIVSLFAPMPAIIEVLDSLSVSMAGAIMFIYALPALGAVKRGSVSRVNLLVAGIALTWFAVALDRFWRLTWRLTGRPEWMINHSLLGLFMTLMIFGGVLHLASTGSQEGEIPIGNWRLIVAAIIVGVVLGMGMILGVSFLDIPATRRL